VHGKITYLELGARVCVLQVIQEFRNLGLLT